LRRSNSFALLRFAAWIESIVIAPMIELKASNADGSFTTAQRGRG
jgi:hypothetical protein